MSQEYITNSSEQTKRLAKEFTQEVLKKKPGKGAFVIGLIGELGGGKTTFIQGLARGLGIKNKILSPTFVIYKKFQIPNSKKHFKNFYHIDCYRIQKPKELLDLGFKEIVSDSSNIVVVEWAEKVKKILPRDTFWIEFDFVDKDTRKIFFKFKKY